MKDTTTTALTTTRTVTTFTVSRSNWFRGQGSKDSRLLRPQDRKMCCLGFYALACGATPEEILGLGFPTDIPATSKAADEVKWLDAMQEDGEYGTDRAELIIGGVNDRPKYYMSEEEREEELKKYFAAQGITVIFAD